MSRRFTQILIGYIGGSWGVLQALDWSVGHYLLSKSLVDFFVDFALLMLPAVLLLAWYIGRDKREPLHTRLVGVGVPLNVVVAAVVLFIVFHGKRLGATTEVVAVHDDSGALVERRIPKAEFRRRLAIFTFESDVSDPKEAWLRQALPELLTEDLRQDPFIEAQDSYYMRDLFHKAHLGYDSVVPLAFARQVADSRHYDFFVLGHIGKEGSQYRVRATLHAAPSGHEVAQKELAGPDLCVLADELSLALRRELGISAPHLESAPDLPVCDIVTHSMLALAETIAAGGAYFDDDPASAQPHLEKAVALDPTYASASVRLVFSYFQSHDQGKMRLATKSTLANVYKLSEPERFYFNAICHLLDGNFEKERAVLTNWVTLYPESSEAKKRLAEHYERRDQRVQAVALLEEAQALDPASTDILTKLVSLHMQGGEIEPAAAIYRRFLAQFPKDADVHDGLADLYLAAARLDEAKQSYDRALAIDDDNVRAAVGVADVAYARGQRDESVAALHKLLEDTKLLRDRLLVYDDLVSDYSQRGQMRQALATFRQRQHEYEPTALVMNSERAQLQQMRLFVLSGHLDEARRIVAHCDGTAAAKENINLRITLQMAHLDLAEALEDPAAMAAALPPFQETIRSFGLEEMRSIDLYYDARRREMEHDWAGALASWQAAEKLNWSMEKAATGVGRCLRQLERLDAARAQLRKSTAHFVSDPDGYYELALAEREHDPAAARAALTTALAIWAPADADYKPALAARTLATALGLPPPKPPQPPQP